MLIGFHFEHAGDVRWSHPKTVFGNPKNLGVNQMTGPALSRKRQLVATDSLKHYNAT